MSPRPADLDIETQRNLAYAALGHMDVEHRKVLLYWMCEHYPHMFLTVAEDFAGYGYTPDGFDQAD